MSEMSAEKKKEIEKYIIKSYFGGGKNVESFGGGVDVITGTDDGRIPHLIVEVTYFGGSGVVMINWDVYDEPHGTEWKNSFAMHICREREIERNRCDSVDSMVYAWESWRSKIQGKPIFLKTNDEDLQKDKRIEDLENEIKALRAEKEVMDRHIQELESQNVSLAETNAVLNNKLNKLDPLPEFMEILKKLYSTNDIENLEWTLNHVCGGRGSVNGWIAVSLFWKQKYETISKLVGFMTVEEIQDYLTNEAECETLYKAISKLKGEVKHACNEWYGANSSNNSWKAAAECNTPKELIEKLKLLRDDISGRSTVIESYKHDIESLEAVLRASNSAMQKELNQEITKWQEATGCASPEEAKTLIDCEASWRHAYNDVKEKNHELESQIEEWKDKTQRCTPFLAGVRLNALHDNYIRHRNLLFGEVRPEVMVCVGGDKKTIRRYLRDRDFASIVNAINELESEIDDWRKATGCLNPHYAKIKIDAYDSYIGTKLEKKD